MQIANAPFIWLCGAPGTGKSAAAFTTFQDSFAILSSKNNIHYYAKRLRTGKLDPAKYRMPKKIKLIDTTVIGVTNEPYSGTEKLELRRPKGKNEKGEEIILPRVDVMNELRSTIAALLVKTREAVEKKEAPPYPNVIIDETGEMLDRCFSQLLPIHTNKETGKTDTRSAFGEANEWIINEIADNLRQLASCGVGVCGVYHDRDPEAAKTGYKAKKGGIKAVSANIARKLTAMSDGCLQRYIYDPMPGELNEDGTEKKREFLWDAEASSDWDLKLRGLDPEDFHLVARSDLYDTLTVLAGFDMWLPTWQRQK